MPNYLDYNGLEHYNNKIKSIQNNIITGGFKNYLDFNLQKLIANNSTSWDTWNDNVNTKTQGGYTTTFTYNSADNSITINSVDAPPYFEFTIRSRINEALTTPFTLPVGEYFAKGFVTNVNIPEGLFFGVNRTVDGSGKRYGTDTGEGFTFTVTDPTAPTSVWIGFDNADPLPMDNIIIKPMIYRKDIYDVSPEYQPYAMSNLEITKNLITTAEIDAMWNS